MLAPGGFAFEVTSTGHGPGGGYASERFTRPGQYLELHLRRALGLVTDSWDGQVLSHQDYLRGVGAAGAYPGYSRNILDGFRHTWRQTSPDHSRGSKTATAPDSSWACGPRNRNPPAGSRDRQPADRIPGQRQQPS